MKKIILGLFVMITSVDLSAEESCFPFHIFLGDVNGAELVIDWEGKPVTGVVCSYI